ncbi:MAG: hypothetical protein ACO1SV_07640 [Fimbriimonas sp.]
MLIPLQLPPIPLTRSIKPGQTDRYRAESDWNGAGNVANYKYEMVMQAARYLERKPEFVEATFRMESLQMTQNEEKMPRVKLAGVFGVQMRPNGAPGKLRMGGVASTLGFPLLGWYLPDTVGADGRFTVAETEIENGVTAAGWGRLTSLAGGVARFSYELGIGRAGSGDTERDIRYRGVSRFRLDTGQLVSCEGEVIEPNGTLTFKILKK